MTTCPCGSGRDLDSCCGPIVEGGKPAPTAESLMRARYTAFTLGRTDFVNATLAPEAQEDYDPAETEVWAKESQWRGLDVRRVEGGGEGDETGLVEFVARYRFKNKELAHHELARFRKQDGKWMYSDGEINPKPPQRIVEQKIGRNDPCHCGSGKKFKKCHGAAA